MRLISMENCVFRCLFVVNKKKKMVSFLLSYHGGGLCLLFWSYIFIRSASDDTAQSIRERWLKKKTGNAVYLLHIRIICIPRLLKLMMSLDKTKIHNIKKYWLYSLFYFLRRTVRLPSFQIAFFSFASCLSAQNIKISHGELCEIFFLSIRRKFSHRHHAIVWLRL